MLSLNRKVILGGLDFFKDFVSGKGRNLISAPPPLCSCHILWHKGKEHTEHL